MVKGLSRRVVVVRFPETKMFEQAIFFVKDEEQKGISVQEVISEACTVAEGYIKKGRIKPRLSPLIYLGIGSGITGIAWLVCTLVFK